jgi:multiple sugar transport system substrate-binding protein
MAKKQLSRREFLVGAAGAGGAALLAACAPQVIEKTVEVPVEQTVVVEKEKTVVVEAPKGEETVVLTAAHAWEAAFEAHQEEFDNKWMEQNPNVFVKRVNSEWSNHNQIVPTWAAAGELPDIIYVHGSRAFPWNKEGIMISIDDYLAADAAFDVKGVWPEALRLYQYKGKQFEIPYDHGPVIMGYNKDLFDKAGEPYPTADWTMDDFLAKAKKLTDKKNNVFGYSGYYGNTFTIGNEIGIALVGPWGGKIFEDDESKLLLDSPEAMEALKWWAQMIKDGISPNPAESQSFPAGVWIAGQAAMFGLATWGIPQMHEFGTFQYDVAPWPKGPVQQKTGSFGSGYGITKDSKNPDVAWKYMSSYLSKDGMEYMWGTSGRGSPARAAAYDSYLKAEVNPPSAKYFKEAMDNYAETGHPYQTSASSEVSDIFTKYTGLVSSGEMSVEDCVANIMKEGNEKLAAAAAA